MIKNIFIKSLLSLVVLLAVSCKDLLKVEPRQSIDAVTALKTPEAVNAAILGVYDRMQTVELYGRDLMALGEALADNGEATNKSGRLNPEYQNQPNAHFTLWGTSYVAINQCNLILDAVDNVTGLSATEKNSIAGQAFFLRALFYHNLVRCYGYDPGTEIAQSDRGGVPISLKGIVADTEITSPARAKVSEVYEQIYKDLDASIARLDVASNARAPFIVSRAAVLAFYSRVALNRRDYAKAVQMATDAINSGVGRFQTNANYVSAWRASIHPESIFELRYVTNENPGVNTSIQTTYTTLIAVGDRTRTGGFGDLVPTQTLLDAYEAGDVRRNLYELGTAGRGAARIECTKFMGKNGQLNLDNIPIIRISELYLNRAEAQYNLSRATEANTDMNLIRTRAGLASRDLAGSELLEEILKQRRVELAFEGQRWFDLKRLGRDIVKAPRPTLPFNDFRMLAPMPVRELQVNSNLVQNAGY